MKIKGMLILWVAMVVGLEGCSYFQPTAENNREAKCRALGYQMKGYPAINNQHAVREESAQMSTMQKEYDQLGCNN